MGLKHHLKITVFRTSTVHGRIPFRQSISTCRLIAPRLEVECLEQHGLTSCRLVSSLVIPAETFPRRFHIHQAIQYSKIQISGRRKISLLGTSFRPSLRSKAVKIYSSCAQLTLRSTRLSTVVSL